MLTKQDRRSQAGEGWGNDGTWYLEADAQTTPEVVLLFTKPVSVDEASWGQIKSGYTDGTE